MAESNPGLTKATEAAKVVGAKLAVAKFPDTGGKSTDFNDLATLVRTSQNVVLRTLKLPKCKRARDYCRDMFNDTCYLPQSLVRKAGIPWEERDAVLL